MTNKHTLADILIEACMSDEFPNHEECLKLFMFDKCRNIEECSNLLGVYIGLIKLNPKFDRTTFYNAINNNNIINYVLTTYNRLGDSYYITWFKLNLERFLFVT